MPLGKGPAGKAPDGPVSIAKGPAGGNGNGRPPAPPTIAPNGNGNGNGKRGTPAPPPPGVPGVPNTAFIPPVSAAATTALGSVGGGAAATTAIGASGKGGSATQLLPLVPRPLQTQMPDLARRRTRIANNVPVAAVYLLIITLTFGQRFIVPGTDISISLPVAYLVLIAMAVRGQLKADTNRVALYLAAVAACLIVTVATSAAAGPEPSFTSLMLLVTLYIPVVFRGNAALRGQYNRVMEFFQRCVAVTAAFCLLQWGIQVVGIPYEDLIETYVPPLFLYPEGFYNTTYPIYYGSSILRSNGFVYLEPSFTSQFLALAIVIQLMMGDKRWRLGLLGLAMLTTVSGTGIVLMAAGVLVLAIRRGGAWTARIVAVALVAGLIVSVTPIGQVLLDRSGESSEAGSSGNARFVAPYTNVTDAMNRDQSVFIIGRGAGAVDADQAFFNPLGINVNYPALPKLLGEYGVIATLIFLAFILTVFLRNVPSPTVGMMVLLLYFVLSGALLQPQTVYLCWLLTGLFAAGRAGEVAGRKLKLSASASALEQTSVPDPIRPAPVPRGGGGPRFTGPRQSDRTMAVAAIRRQNENRRRS